MATYIVWGDSHIPYRAEKLPTKFIEFVEKVSPSKIICTGDLVRKQVLRFFLEKDRELVVVRGNMDEGEAGRFPLIQLFEEFGHIFMVFHGHGIYPRGDPAQLYRVAKKKDARILFTGHTHSPVVEEYRDLIIVNPGSVCGVWGGGGGYGRPTWGLVRVRDEKLDVEIYELVGGEVLVYARKSFEL